MQNEPSALDSHYGRVIVARGRIRLQLLSARVFLDTTDRYRAGIQIVRNSVQPRIDLWNEYRS
jgi:hypothetical protein